MSETHLLSEKQIVTVLQHMSPLTNASKLATSAGLCNDNIALLIVTANQTAYNTYRSRLNDCYTEQQINVEHWKSIVYSLSNSTHQPISHLHCFKYLQRIIYHCEGSPAWKDSFLQKILDEWYLYLLEEIFKDILHLAPEPSTRTYHSYKRAWLEGLADTLAYSTKYAEINAWLT